MNRDTKFRLLSALETLQRALLIPLIAAYAAILSGADIGGIAALLVFAGLCITTIAMSLIRWSLRDWRVSIRGLLLTTTLVALIFGLWAAVGLFG
jgi:hypothetical protein